MLERQVERNRIWFPLIIQEQCPHLMNSDASWRRDNNPVAYWKMQSRKPNKEQVGIARGRIQIPDFVVNPFILTHQVSMAGATNDMASITHHFMCAFAWIKRKLTVAISQIELAECKLSVQLTHGNGIATVPIGVINPLPTHWNGLFYETQNMHIKLKSRIKRIAGWNHTMKLLLLHTSNCKCNNGQWTYIVSRLTAPH